MNILNKTDLEKREEQILAPYALKSGKSKGRAHIEPTVEQSRTNFQLDRDRIIHTKAFRRLKGKTQVLSPGAAGDHFRDRLTHTLEVTQISRDLARNFNLNEDAAEAIALAHDLGHSPFGHAGETALNECLQAHGLSFEHNEQSKRVVTEIEELYPQFSGLNLSLEIIEGLEKHQTPFDQVNQEFIGASLEAQIVNIADEIAYLNHDIDDGLRLKILKPEHLQDLEIWQEAVTLSQELYQVTDIYSPYRFRIISSLMKLMIRDLIKNTAQIIDVQKFDSIESIYQHKNEQLVSFSAPMRAKVNQLRKSLYQNFYLSPIIQEPAQQGQQIIKELFAYYLAKTDQTPPQIRDYIAGMTDSFAAGCLMQTNPLWSNCLKIPIMICPKCKHENTKVIDSRDSNDNKVIRRRRECEACAYRFTTFENVATANFIVIKKDNSREPYNRQKLAQGIWKACEKRKISQDQIEELLNELEEGWSSLGKEVQSTKLGEGVMNRLRDLDEVAYIRFASVYRQFKDIETFKEELQKLLG